MRAQQTLAVGLQGYPWMGLSKDETKRIVKEAIKEWLDGIFLKFGKWSLAAIGATALAFLLKAVVLSQLWRKLGE